MVLMPVPERYLIKRTVVIYAIAVALLFFDAIAGPLRFFAGAVGAEIIIYLPKMLALSGFCLTLLFSRQPGVVWITLGMIALSATAGLSNGIPIIAMVFAVFLISPFLLGLITPDPTAVGGRLFWQSVFWLWLITIVGIWLDVFIDFPWKGTALELLGTSVESSRSWSTVGIERPAGFARLSAVAAFYAGGLGTMLFALSERTLRRIAVLITTIATVVVTTNKSAMGGMLVVVAFTVLRYVPLARHVSFTGLFIVAICLPLFGGVFDYSINPQNEAQVFLAASFDDRLVNTWPNFFNGIRMPLIGEGLGGVGTAVRQFGAQATKAVLGVADNTELYLIGWFGLFEGVLIYSWIGLKAYRLASGNHWQGAIGMAGIFFIACSFTTDMFEAPIASFLFGILVRFNLSPQAVSRKVSVRPEQDSLLGSSSLVTSKRLL